MALKNQQDTIIRLCTEKDLLFLFSNIRQFRKMLAKSTGEPLFVELDLKGVTYQADAIKILLLNDLKANLTETFSNQKLVADIEKFYFEYTAIFPTRHKNKFEEYVRFLGFLLYKITGTAKYADLGEWIKTDYAAFCATLKRERLLKELPLLKEQKNNTKRYIINPTLVSERFLAKNGKSIYKVFFYELDGFEISIAEINKKLHVFIENNRYISFNETELIAALKLGAKYRDQRDIMVESGLLIKI
jgi:hypothetical protein